MKTDKIEQYKSTSSTEPLLLCGDSLDVLKSFPDNSIDMCITSPPYWNKREYANGGIGLEKDFTEYIDNLLLITKEVYRVLKPTGSFWLNLGDSYKSKNLLGIPWRVAIKMTDEQKWILRNSVIWDKVKGGPDNSKDKLRNIHENIFHFVKKNKGYYYDADSIRNNPKKAKVENGSVVSATGVSGVRYKRKIELSTELSDLEKENATKALEEVLIEIQEGKLSDFRMVIRGVHRVTHSDSTKVSGRAKELVDKGYYFLKYHPKGSKPSDIWSIIPEDTQKRKSHFAPYPTDLCRIPIIATCPPGGIVLDPFCGTGTSLVVAKVLGRKSVGIDIANDYIDLVKGRISIDE